MKGRWLFIMSNESLKLALVGVIVGVVTYSAGKIQGKHEGALRGAEIAMDVVKTGLIQSMSENYENENSEG